MYPNATHGFMPFVKPAHKRQAAKKSRMDHKEAIKAKSGDLKTYKVTLRDRKGFTYTYIIQADTTSKNMPVLCESKVAAPRTLLFNSLPNVQKSSPTSSPEARRQAVLFEGKDDLTKLNNSEDGEKRGLFNSLINFIKKKTGGKSSSSKSKPSQQVKSKRKPKTGEFPKKRLRTISARSNLDTIQESPEEDNDDSDSYTHDSASSAEYNSDGSVSES